MQEAYSDIPDDYIEIDDWQFEASTDGAIILSNGYKRGSSKFKTTAIPRRYIHLTEDKEVYVAEWIAQDRGLI